MRPSPHPPHDQLAVDPAKREHPATHANDRRHYGARSLRLQLN